MSSPTKFCKDCRHRRRGFIEPMSMAKCLHPQSEDTGRASYLVDANGRKRLWCSDMRRGACGPDAKFWEPR